MANIKSRLKTPKRASTKSKGSGVINKSHLRVSSRITNRCKPTKLNLMTSDDKVQLAYSRSTKVKVIDKDCSNNDGIVDVLLKTKGIKTRSSCKQRKYNLKAMDINILKSELMIVDGKKKSDKNHNSPSNGMNNNNDTAIDYQNNSESISAIDSQINEQDVVINLGKNSKRIMSNDMTGPKEDPKSKKNTKRTSPKVTKDNSNNKWKNKENSQTKGMAKELREDVLNNMKNVLSSDNVLSTESNGNKEKHTNKRVSAEKDKQKEENQAKKRKIQDENIEQLDAVAAKMKQVTLSNGVVLTLALVSCDFCHKAFSNKSSLSRHMLIHLDLKPHRCSKCSKKFRTKAKMKNHFQRCHSVAQTPEFHVCHICDKVFLLEENLELHLGTHVKTENNFQCIYCDKKFSYRLLLTQHEKTHLVTGRFKCYLCEQTYDTRKKLTYHIQSHSKVKDYICHYCGKEFRRMNSIKRHVQVCHGGKRIQCPICLKELKGHLTEHMRTHSKNRPHVCPDCGQRFIQSTQLNAHIRSHTGLRPYPCRICDRPFGHSNALMLHMRRHTGEKPFQCAMCPLTFSQLPHMKKHMSKIHGKDSAYKCRKCSKFFKLKNELGQHEKLCTVGDKELSFEEKIQASVQVDEEIESVMSLSKMRFLLALLLTKIASKEKLKYLGFNKRLIDDLLVESLEAMGYSPCQEEDLSPLKQLKMNIEILLNGTIPSHQMDKFRSENKSTEEILVLLTDEKNEKIY